MQRTLAGVKVVFGEKSVVKDKNVAFSGHSFWDHIRFMGVGKAAEFFCLPGPDNIPSFPVDELDFVEVTGIVQNISRLETLVPGVIPPVFRQYGNGVAVRPVGNGQHGNEADCGAGG